jgi:uncharacterized HAD superfamily protein
MEKNNTKGLVVDIDETISWTVGYWIKEMQKKFGNPENLSVEDMVKKYKYTQNVPYWQTELALDWMEEKRMEDKLQEKLSVIKNSASILKKINRIIPIVAYITTRPKKVAKGTKKWLVKNKFPKAEIILKPNNILTKDDNKWKAEILKSLYPKVVAIIDDNASLIDYLPKNYKGTIFLYDSIKYKTNKVKVISCKSWKNVLSAVKKFVAEESN